MSCEIVDFVALRSQRRIPHRVYWNDAQVHRINVHLSLCGICGSSRHRASACPLRPTSASPTNHAD